MISFEVCAVAIESAIPSMIWCSPLDFRLDVVLAMVDLPLLKHPGDDKVEDRVGDCDN